MVKKGITGMSDDLTHDKVVVLSPEITMGYVKSISQLIIKADLRLSQI